MNRCSWLPTIRTGCGVRLSVPRHRLTAALVAAVGVIRGEDSDGTGRLQRPSFVGGRLPPGRPGPTRTRPMPLTTSVPAAVSGQPDAGMLPVAMTGVVLPRGHAGIELRYLVCGRMFTAARRCGRIDAATRRDTESVRRVTHCDQALEGGRSDRRYCDVLAGMRACLRGHRNRRSGNSAWCGLGGGLDHRVALRGRLALFDGVGHRRPRRSSRGRCGHPATAPRPAHPRDGGQAGGLRSAIPVPARKSGLDSGLDRGQDRRGRGEMSTIRERCSMRPRASAGTSGQLLLGRSLALQRRRGGDDVGSGQ